MKNRRELGQQHKNGVDAMMISLSALEGQKVASMSNKEKESLLVVIGQLLGLIDSKGEVKASK